MRELLICFGYAIVGLGSFLVIYIAARLVAYACIFIFGTAGMVIGVALGMLVMITLFIYFIRNC